MKKNNIKKVFRNKEIYDPFVNISKVAIKKKIELVEFDNDDIYGEYFDDEEDKYDTYYKGYNRENKYLD